MINKLINRSLQSLFSRLSMIPENRYHPFVWINGNPQIGEGVYIGGFSEVNAKGATVTIKDNCDIASFVSINCADSHRRCISISEAIELRDILIEENVFIGSHSVIKGGAVIGHHSVVGAGSIVGAITAPPYSLIVGNPAVVKPGYYLNEVEVHCDTP